LDASDDKDWDLNDDNNEEEEAALQAELAKIRSERAAAKAKEEAEAEEEEQAQMEETALTGNPLLSSGSASSSTGRLKRRWNDDVAFRNQARGEPDQNKKEEEEVDAAAAASASVEEEADEVADNDPSIITHSRLIDGDGAIWKANGEMQEEVSRLSSYFIILH
jgi:hypothetical protein